MSDLIDRQAAIDAFRQELVFDYEEQCTTFAGIKKMLESLPSAQPEIIRCKDCKWSDWYTGGDGNQYCFCMETDRGGRTETDFCSYAERRTDE